MTTADDFNAIDPSLVSGPSGSKYLVFGSFWSGIKLLPLDPATGKPASPSPAITSLAEQPAPDPLEGGGITFHDGYYYLFASQGFCCRGIGSSYNIIAGRSRSITGPYVDPQGTDMMNAGGMEVQGASQGMIGPGSAYVFQDGGHSDLVYHYYDAFDSADAWVQVRPIVWTPDGWPVTGQALVPVPGSPVPSSPGGWTATTRPHWTGGYPPVQCGRWNIRPSCSCSESPISSSTFTRYTGDPSGGGSLAASASSIRHLICRIVITSMASAPMNRRPQSVAITMPSNRPSSVTSRTCSRVPISVPERLSTGVPGTAPS